LDRFVYKNPKKAVSGQQLLPFICFFVWLCWFIQIVLLQYFVKTDVSLMCQGEGVMVDVAGWGWLL
jgi:hypothetical protein